ncbi:hypothetical protein LCGC14_0334900 [marine sediment metagenome]|uniref:Uncharacterized protein n=1 Tax=marine sediment metagenome TaxID=412755 RepID=A0A0F9TYD8_9ZZZZ
MTKPLSKTEKKARAKAMASTVEIKKKIPAKPKKKPATKAKKAPLGPIPDIVNYVVEEGPFSMKEQRECAPGLDNDAVYREAEEAVKLGWLRKNKKGIYSLARKVPKKKAPVKNKPVTKAKKAAKTELSDKDLNDVEEVVDFLMDNCPDRSPPVTAGELDSEAIGGPQVLRNALKLGRIVKDGDGYRLNKGGDVAMGALAILQKVEEESVRCAEELAEVKKLYDEGRKKSATVEPALRTKVTTLEKQITGWELRNNIQIATYRLERWEAGLLSEGIQETGRSLAGLRMAMNDGLTGGVPGDATIGDYRTWAFARLDELNAALAILNRYSYPRAGVMTEVKPEPSEDFDKMLTCLVSQDTGRVEWPRKRT